MHRKVHSFRINRTISNGYLTDICHFKFEVFAWFVKEWHCIKYAHPFLLELHLCVIFHSQTGSTYWCYTVCIESLNQFNTTKHWSIYSLRCSFIITFVILLYDGNVLTDNKGARDKWKLTHKKKRTKKSPLLWDGMWSKMKRSMCIAYRSLLQSSLSAADVLCSVVRDQKSVAVDCDSVP